MLEYIYAEYDKLLNKYYKLYHTEFKTKAHQAEFSATSQVSKKDKIHY